MHPTLLHRSRPKLLAASVVLALAACASTPLPNTQLDEARAAYLRTSADPVAARVAARELQQASDALGRADAAYKAGEPVDQVNHLAYLAKQRVGVAEQTAQIANADVATADAKAQRERIVLQSRTREAQTAQQLAEQRQAEALAAQRLAEQRQADAEAARRQASASQDRAQSLEQQLKDLQARQTDRGMVLTLGDVLFDTGAATLKPGAMRTVEQLAAFLAQHPSNRVLIEGYTDSVGNGATNLELSQRRADAVRNALAQRGVPGNRVEARGLGEAYAVASNDTAGGRQLNRRVEIVFSDEQGAFRSSRQ